ncbi:putative UDP-sugar transporter protein SLC35A5 [Triplophysa tibetana]|uniref:Putative UDP-sugar transporter protein SLC35A5 n=1 Tax=Triplophysa tibetana TaxID=1572043 RepID=A0A5A9P137_9TELE|nr:putative UDP-sugar transporter protein SLC35A5 [Triplophysa tibetana]
MRTEAEAVVRLFVCVSTYGQVVLFIMAPFSSSSCCGGPSSRVCSRSSVYTLALGLGFITLGTSRILLLKFSANEEGRSRTGFGSFLSYLKWRHLSWVQWASLIILFLAIVSLTTGNSEQHTNAVHIIHRDGISSPSNSCLKYTHPKHQNASDWMSDLPRELWDSQLIQKLNSFGLGYILLLLQCFISALANIYNEKILKEGEQLAESIFIQNSKLYLFGLIFNSLTLLLHSDYRDLTLHCGLFYGHNVFSIALPFVTAALGLSVAFILKFRDNMFHVLTGQITTVIITTLSVFLFDFQPSMDFFLQAPVVLLAIFIYHSSRLKDPEYVLQEERLRVFNGEVFERSRGDGEELERLTKDNTESESEDNSF